MTNSLKRQRSQIGLDRLVLLQWLERTAALVLGGNDEATIKSTLQADLKESLRSDDTNVRGSIDKSVTILLRVWVRTPHDLAPLRSTALTLLENCEQSQRVAIHWGMLSAVYPFWARVAGQVGRLLQLQGHAASNQVQRRIREQYGERETVSRRVRYVLRSFVDWHVLAETDQKGVYTAGPRTVVQDMRLAAWLIEASLYAHGDGSAPLRELINSPSLFPFQLGTLKSGNLLSASTRLDILRHGLDDEIIMLQR